MTFSEFGIGVDLSQKKANINFQLSSGGFVNISGFAFDEPGPHTDEEQKQKVRRAARRLLEELLQQLPA